MSNGGYPSQEARAEALTRARRLQEHGPGPRGPVTVIGPQGPVSCDPEAYDPAADLAAGDGAVERFPMPAGGYVWVHALSPEEALWLNTQVLRHLQRLKIQRSDPQWATAWTILSWVYQAIACCRRGADPAAPPVWTVEQADALFRNRRPGHEVLQKIAKTCDRLGAAGTEAPLSEELVGFFDVMASWLRTLSSQWTTDSPELGPAALEACAAFVSRIALQGKLSAQELGEFPSLAELRFPMPAE